MGWESQIDRRQFLAVAAGAGLTAVGFAKGSEVEAAIDYKKDEGVWTDEQKQRLAESMIGRLGIPQVQEAGRMLVDNLVGKPVFDAKSDYTIDERNDGGSVKRIDIVNSSILGTAPSGSLHSYVGEIVPVQVNVKGSAINTKENSNTGVSKIYLNTNLLPKMSDWGIEIIVAAELLEYKTLDDLMHFVESKRQNLPTDDRARRATLLYYMENDIPVLTNTDTTTNIPVNFTIYSLLGSWTCFAILPDYLKTKDLSHLTQNDINVLNFYGKAANFLLSDGILSKDQNGNYNWGQDEQLKEKWMSVARIMSIGNIQIVPKQPQKPGPIIPTNPQIKPA